MTIKSLRESQVQEEKVKVQLLLTALLVVVVMIRICNGTVAK